MKKDLIVPVGTSPQDATEVALARGCTGFYIGIPPAMIAQAAADGWILPCVVTEDEDGNVVAWEAI